MIHELHSAWRPRHRVLVPMSGLAAYLLAGIALLQPNPVDAVFGFAYGAIGGGLLLLPFAMSGVDDADH